MEKKKKMASVKYWRGRLNERQSYQGGRGLTEETHRCRNNRGIERVHVSNSVEKTDGVEAGEERENGKRRD